MTTRGGDSFPEELLVFLLVMAVLGLAFWYGVW